jgi:hypothetical protein
MARSGGVAVIREGEHMESLIVLLIVAALYCLPALMGKYSRAS